MNLTDDPENLLNDRTSHGLVSIAVPSSPHTLIRSWPWPWHLELEEQQLMKPGHKEDEEKYVGRGLLEGQISGRTILHGVMGFHFSVVLLHCFCFPTFIL